MVLSVYKKSYKMLYGLFGIQTKKDREKKSSFHDSNHLVFLLNHVFVYLEVDI